MTNWLMLKLHGLSTLLITIWQDIGIELVMGLTIVALLAIAVNVADKRLSAKTQEPRG
jgi:hypothetical protein